MAATEFGMSSIRLALLGMALAACRGAAAQTPSPTVPPIAVRTAVALDEQLSDDVELPGTLQADRRASLSVLAPGRVDAKKPLDGRRKKWSPWPGWLAGAA